MSRRTRFVIVLTLSVVIAAVATPGCSPRCDGSPDQKTRTHRARRRRHAGGRDGTVLTEEHVKVAQWPARTPVANAYSDKKEVIARGLLASILENEPLTKTKLAPAQIRWRAAAGKSRRTTAPSP